jgi:hypothetical protein
VTTPLIYALQFRGRASRWPARRLVAELSAPSCALVTNLHREGMRGRHELVPGGDARLWLELCLDGGRMRAYGTVSFGAGHELCLATVASTRLRPPPDPHVTHACAITQVLGGAGQFRSARGQIVSNLLIHDTGEVTDNHLGVIFVEAHPPTKGAHHV